jgi:isochorismate synthase EntC
MPVRAVFPGTREARSRGSMIMRNEIELHLQTRRLLLEIERQKAMMRVAAAHLEQAEKANNREKTSIRELLQRLRPDPAIDGHPEPEAI